MFLLSTCSFRYQWETSKNQGVLWNDVQISVCNCTWTCKQVCKKINDYCGKLRHHSAARAMAVVEDRMGVSGLVSKTLPSTMQYWVARGYNDSFLEHWEHLLFNIHFKCLTMWNCTIIPKHVCICCSISVHALSKNWQNWLISRLKVLSLWQEICILYYIAFIIFCWGQE